VTAGCDATCLVSEIEQFVTLREWLLWLVKVRLFRKSLASKVLLSPSVEKANSFCGPQMVFGRLKRVL
jgi:hypothetical protein